LVLPGDLFVICRRVGYRGRHRSWAAVFDRTPVCVSKSVGYGRVGVLDDTKLLERAQKLGFSPGDTPDGMQAWFRGGAQASPAFLEWQAMMGWMRRELNEDE
jgi:hypothetical protein